jgi:hypothetical protein
MICKSESLASRLGQLRQEARRQGMVGLERELAWASCGAPEAQAQALILGAERRLRQDHTMTQGRNLIKQLAERGHSWEAFAVAEEVRRGDRARISKTIGKFSNLVKE